MGLDEARAALELGDFRLALEHIDPGDDSEPALELRATASYGAGSFEATLAAYEALHRKQEAAGRTAEAAQTAATIALHLLVDSGLMAPVRGWVARAERLARDTGPAPVHALLAMVRAYERFMCGDPAAARAAAEEAVDLGTRFGVDAAVAMGQVATARLMMYDGAVVEGLALLDEVAVRLMSGELDPFTTGNMYCELICAAQALSLHDRAREWTEVMERWRHDAAFGALHGRCRVHRAELLRVSGPADAAEREALQACVELEPWMRREYGWPLVELGNIRLRRGDLDGAEKAFTRAHDLAWDAQPGLALLRLEQGDAVAAAQLIADAVAHPVELPWKERPPFGDLRLAPLLAARAEIAAAVGDVATARASADALEQIAQRYPGPGLAASAALADARAALLAADTTTAARQARCALVAWIEMEAPYDAGMARTVLAEALAAAGSPTAAASEWSAAATAFEEFGASRRAAGALARLGQDSVRSPRRATAPDVATLRRKGEYWEVGFRGRTAVLAGLKGVGYLERLLAEPGREFHVLQLVAAEAVDGGLPVLDDEAKASYRRRLAEVDDDIAEAEADHDLARRQLATRDREYLIAELTRAVGLWGSARTTGGTAERARGAVTRSLRYALARLAEQHPDLGAHLERTVRTGVFCSYQPDPIALVDWRIG